MRFLAALQFLTIIPILTRRRFTTKEISGSVGYFPLVGIIIGLILAGLNWLLNLFLPPAVVNGLLLVSMVVITGALHIDGFIDTCDGIAGHKTVEDRWRIMHDSRAGAFGIVGAFLLLLVKYLSLNSIPGGLLMLALVIMPVVSRWAMVYAIFAYPYARPEGLGKIFKEGANLLSLTGATIIAIGVPIVYTFYLEGLALIFAVWIITVGMAYYLKRKFAGLTGDTYGAINEVAEVSVLLLILVYNRLV